MLNNDLDDHIYALFCNQADTDNRQSVINACVYFVQNDLFDIDVLPKKLYDAVDAELEKDAIERLTY
jgi:hypothetical protein